VDAETGELHPSLSDGQRRHDQFIAEENIAGELLDVEGQFGLPENLDPVETAGEIGKRYEDLWCELIREEVFGLDERFRIEHRLRRLNELGFDVEEVELVGAEDGYRLRFQPKVVEPGHHRRRLYSLTGLAVQENQARRLLNDLAGYRGHLERVLGHPLPEPVAAYRWLSEVFQPAIAAVPADLLGKLDAAEIYHQLLEHRWFLSEAAGRDVGMKEAVASYVDEVLRFAPSEQALVPAPEGSEEPATDLTGR
jgi:hypothetical protein